MKFETYNKAYDLVQQCAHEADAMQEPTVRTTCEEALAKLHDAWNLLQTIERDQDNV